jgi:hypothetical protein
MALAMTDSLGDRKEVGRWQGGFPALPSANLFHTKVKERGLGPKQSQKTLKFL